MEILPRIKRRHKYKIPWDANDGIAQEGKSSFHWVL